MGGFDMERKCLRTVDVEMKKWIKTHLEKQTEKLATPEYFEQMHQNLHRRLRVEMIKEKSFSEMFIEKLQRVFLVCDRYRMFQTAVAGSFLFVFFLGIVSFNLLKNHSKEIPNSLITKYESPKIERVEKSQLSQALSPSTPPISLPSKQDLEVESTKLAPNFPNSKDPHYVIRDALTHYEAMVAF
ncbi:hypothetical protein A946_04775 [Methylacidiphilum kamchatkense Kam1]|uniref:Uncharacterized protein n=2 Tax=Methylacidiphilum kamchatkense Kam1 TaxID=1202785 RepID=A0ABR4ZYD9_9BACT|nr:hypothetical protein [Methylacidiphilum kamchatkense]KIE58741.1 hypothetical protein A946_04775 [Methylacidiphilum kamchatkense Kam1]